MCKLNHLPLASPERLLVSAVRERVSPSLADWIGDRVKAGADIDEVERRLTSAVGQIIRVRHYCLETARVESEPVS